MRRIARVLTGSLLVAAATNVSAQRPDFSGTWVRDDSATARIVATAGDVAFPRGNMGSGWGSPLTITHSAERLGVEAVWFSTYDLQPRLKFAYALNGAESLNVVMIGHADSEQRSTAGWRGDTLVISTRFVAPAGVGPTTTPELRQSLYLDAAKNLVVESRRAGAGGAPNVITVVYRRR